MKRLNNDSGSVIVFVSLIVVFLMLMVALGLDTGWLAFSRSMGQRAVDMAALSGAAGVAKRSTDAVKANIDALKESNDYVKLSSNLIDGTVNGKNVTLITYDYATHTITGTTTDITKAQGVRVALEQSTGTAIDTPSFLTPLLNLVSSGTDTATNVNVSAVAVYHAFPGIPLALGGCNPDQEGPNQNIPFDQVPSCDGCSNSGWTTYTEKETNTPGLISRIERIINCQGGGMASVGTPICLANGANVPVVRAFEKIVDPEGTQCYLTPVVDPIKNFTGCTQPIRQWASICPKALCAPPDSNTNPLCTDKGKKYILADIKSCNVDLDAPSQCYSLRLVREPSAGM